MSSSRLNDFILFVRIVVAYHCIAISLSLISSTTQATRESHICRRLNTIPHPHQHQHQNQHYHKHVKSGLAKSRIFSCSDNIISSSYNDQRRIISSDGYENDGHENKNETTEIDSNQVLTYPSAQRNSNKWNDRDKKAHHNRRRGQHQRERLREENQGSFYQPQDDTFYGRDEKERRELDWVVRNTANILGPDAPIPGTMTQPHISLVGNLMRAWARRSNKRESKAPHVVERLLKRLIHERDEGNKAVSIDTSLYNTVLDSWSSSNEEGSAERSEEILERLEEMFQNGNIDVKPDVYSYNAVIKAYVKNGDRKTSLSKVEAIIERMERTHEQSNDSSSSQRWELTTSSSLPPSTTSIAETTATALPNRRSYNFLLYALANSNLIDAPIRGEKILEKMMRRSMANYNGGDGSDVGFVANSDDYLDDSSRPDINSFNQVLGAWARGRQKGYESKLDSILMQLLEVPDGCMCQANTDTFNAILGGWLKSRRPDAMQRIEQVMQIMEDLYKEGHEDARPDRFTINIITAAYAKDGSRDALDRSMEVCRSMERKYHILPDQISHNIFIDSWCKSGRPEAPEKVMELLDRRERRFRMNGKKDEMPDGFTYSSIIGCFVKCKRPDRTEVAERLLERMKELYHNYGGEPVTTSVFNAVINAWASSDSDYTTKRVKQLLHQMEDENNGQDVPQANRITYNTVVKAMGRGSNGDAEYAEEILRKLESKGVEDKKNLPDSFTYSAVISAYGHSSTNKKAVKALEILQRQIQSNRNGNKAAKPSIHSFNAALNACAYCKGSRNTTARAFEIANKIYGLLQEYADPDQTTFGTMLRACATLLPRTDKDREQMVEEVFQAACESGNVGRLVIKQMKYAATPEQHARLIGRDIMERINPNEIPQAWTRSVNTKKNRSSRWQRR